LIGHGGQGGGLPLQYQRLPVADENIQGTVAVRRGADADQLRQVGDQLIPLVDQFVGRLSAVLRGAHDDLLIQRRDRAGNGIDLCDVRGDA
jgi:hypothetical protein